MNLPKTVPYLPGHQFTDPYKENFHKTQQFSLQNNVNCEKTNFIKEPINGSVLESMRLKTPASLTYGTRRQPENDYIPRVQPAWLKYDRKVLRFSAYFQEAVVESAHENYRIRKCLIYFYLEDGTIHVTEPKIENSGIPQGIFIKRQKIPKKIGKMDQFITWEDLQLGININMFERVFRITDCDEFTQQFYEDMNYPLGQPEPQPSDTFELNKTVKDLKINPPDTKEYKEYFEVKLGGGHPNTGLKKYLENDRKVLSFEIMWDDQSLEGSINYFTLNFFLADETIEVKEHNIQNSGKDPFPLLLHRKKVPKTPVLTHYPGMTLKKEEYYSPSDLVCGKKIVIYNRECLIINCDDFTRQWYEQNLRLQQHPIHLKQERGQKFYQPVPPYNGFGIEEDSLGSVYSLQPKPPRKDINKMFTSDQYILRYEARMISENREYNDNKFIISFFCGDDTIMVYQHSERNSGIWGGKFMERAKHKNPITNQYFVEKDFQIGETLQIGVYSFQLMRADEFTHNYMKERPNIFREANIEHVLLKIKKFSSDYKTFDDFMVQFMKKLDVNQNGFVEFEELTIGLKNLGINLTYQEQYTLFRFFDSNNDWKLSIKELYEGLAKPVNQTINKKK